MTYTLMDVHKVDSFGEIKGNLSVINGDFSYSKTTTSLNISVGEDFFVYPSLINSFDNLSYSYFSRVPYGNYTSMSFLKENMKNAFLKSEKNLFTDYEIILLGCLKNILSGCTHVIDYNNMDPAYAYSTGNFPIDIIRAREELSDTFSEEEMSIPVVEIAKDYTKESEEQTKKIIEKNLLNSKTILFGGINLRKEEQLKEIKKASANLVWTPSSHKNIFNDIAPVDAWLNHKINISLGTDSSMLGSANLLEEIKIASYLYKQNFTSTLDPAILFNMVTLNPAKAFNLNTGDLKEGKRANFIITHKIKSNPFINFLHLKIDDISLVVRDGKPIYGDMKFKSLFEKLGIRYILIQVENETKILAVRGYGILLKKINTVLDYYKYIPFIPLRILN